jgi:hypothetical protein
MARRTASLLVLALVCLSGVPARAQETAPSIETPAHISFVDGAAVLERDGRIDSEIMSMPLLEGDRVRTQGGRVEVLFADGSALHLDANTVVDFQSDDVIRMLDGRIRLAIAGRARDVSYRIDAPSAWVQINDPGEYRVAVLREADVELAVLRGAAELVNEQGRSFIRAGERTFARAGSAPSAPYVFNSAAWDSFDRWSEARRDQRIGVSAQYLPNDVRPYASSFDSYGDWRYEQMYGYVWYPRVSVGWRPYHYGRWMSLRPYGWTWIAGDPWGWPTHHYGRWGISAGSWFWIPGRHWGPAWVSWAYAPNYVSWCPLGWNNRPVYNLVNVNAYGGHRYNPWHAWTVVPRHHFNASHVNVRSFTSVRIDQRVHNTFVVRDTAPDARFAVGRSSPIRTAGRYAVPRGSAPGALSTASGAVTPRISGDRGSLDTERRLPSASRPSRVPSAPPPQATESGSRIVRPTGERAVSRDRTAPAAGVPAYRGSPASTGSATENQAVEPREYRRAPEARRPSEAPGDRPVTAAPYGAVRAVPRVRQPSDAAPIDPQAAPGERARMRQERAPAYSAPSVEQPSRPSAADPGAYRSSPGYRRAPDGDAGSRMRAVPRSDPAPSAPAAPSYRSAPEQRQGPSGPPPSAAPPPQSGPSGDRGDRGSAAGSRQRSGESQSSGQGAQRRR